MAYSNEYNALLAFFKSKLEPYSNIKQQLEMMVDGASANYQELHRLSYAAHVGLIHIRHRGITYQITRSSNIRNTAGFERYVLEVWDENRLWKDEPNLAVKFFRRNWEEWHTIRLLDK